MGSRSELVITSKVSIQMGRSLTNDRVMLSQASWKRSREPGALAVSAVANAPNVSPMLAMRSTYAVASSASFDP